MAKLRVALIVLAILIWVGAGLAQIPTPEIPTPEVPTQEPDPTLPSLNWIQGPNGHYYALSTVKGTWPEVEAQAVSEGGHLVTIRSPEENQFLVDTFLVGQVFCETLPTSGPWIGLNDADGDRVFTWASGEPVTFTNWAINQPDDRIFSGDHENYAQFWSDPTIDPSTGGVIEGLPGGADGTWNDQSTRRVAHCGNALPGIIEATTLQVPPFSPAAAACQQAIGEASLQGMQTVQQQHASCLNSEALGQSVCDPAGRDAAITQTTDAAKVSLDTACTLEAYTELRFFGDTAEVIRDQIIQNTIDTTEILIRQTYPAPYSNKP